MKMSENSSFVSELKIVGVEKIKTKLFNIVIINSCNTFLFYFDEIFLNVGTNCLKNHSKIFLRCFEFQGTI